MKLIITRPLVLAGEGGVRTFAPGLALEVDAATAQHILAQQAGIPVEPAVAPAQTPAQPEAIATSRRRRRPANARA